jgi:8-oxo-dGTP pyrophosphatase MutT (NUDIX family)
MIKEFQSCGASVIVYKDNKILLQQRRDNGCWGYSGGHTELGEKVEDTAKRELFEETGLKVLSMKLFDVFSGPELRHVYPDGNIVHIIDVVYISTEFDGELKLQKSEVLNLKWFDINDIPDNISPPVKPGLNKFIKQIQEEL